MPDKLDDYPSQQGSIDPATESGPDSAGVSLVESIKSDRLADSLAALADASISIGADAGIPVASNLLGLFRATKQIREHIEFNKIVTFLSEIEKTSIDDRQSFVDRIEKKGGSAAFGNNILLILTRLDDLKKPTIVGRIMAAHISGHIDFDRAMRLTAIVNRCYMQDLEYLHDFKPGVQGAGTDLAASLFSAGLLANSGFDGGDFSSEDSGGIMYDINEYGKLLLKYGIYDM